MKFGVRRVYDRLSLRAMNGERTPYIHFVGAPRIIDGKGRKMLSQRQHRVLGELAPGEDGRSSYERVLDQAELHFASLGLVRGERKAAASRLMTSAAAEAAELALSPAEGRQRAAEILGKAVLQRDEILTGATAEGDRIITEAQVKAEAEIAFASHRADVLLGAAELVTSGGVGTKEGAPGTLLARRSEPVAAFSPRFAPLEHDPEEPPRGPFAAIRTAGLWRQVGAFADRVRALLRRETHVADRERVVGERKGEIDTAIASLEADRQAAREDRAVAAGARADALAMKGQAERLLERAAAAGDRMAAAELAMSRRRQAREQAAR